MDMQSKSAQFYSANKWFRYKKKKLKNKKNFNVIYKLYKYGYMKITSIYSYFCKKS
jgi:hypothetical protein